MEKRPGVPHLTPILCEVLHPLEGGDQLEWDEAVFVPLDVLQQELVLGDVRIGEVELDLAIKIFLIIAETVVLVSSLEDIL